MTLRKIELKNDEFYHVYNRGVDKRVVFKDKQDFFQFIQMLDHFNQEESLGGLRECKYPINLEHRGSTSVLVEVVAYCLNKNHYHLILKQVVDNGISKFMQKVGTGYTMYFNKKNKRTGSLFGGRFKSKYIEIGEQLGYVGVYVNLNNKAHKQEHLGSTSVLTYVSGWNEYMNKSKLGLCKKDYLLADFKSIDLYKKYAEKTLKDIIKNKQKMKELELDQLE
jgi:putative transposase